jgi:hypothetical protein
MKGAAVPGGRRPPRYHFSQRPTRKRSPGPEPDQLQRSEPPQRVKNHRPRAPPPPRLRLLRTLTLTSARAARIGLPPPAGTGKGDRRRRLGGRVSEFAFSALGLVSRFVRFFLSSVSLGFSRLIVLTNFSVLYICQHVSHSMEDAEVEDGEPSPDAPESESASTSGSWKYAVSSFTKTSDQDPKNSMLN